METYNEYLDFIERKIGPEFKYKIDKWRKLNPSKILIEEITKFIRPFNNNDRTIIYPLSFERKYKLNDYQKINDDYIIKKLINLNGEDIILYENKNNDSFYKIEKNNKICTIIIDKKINFIGNISLDDYDIKYFEDILNKKRQSF